MVNDPLIRPLFLIGGTWPAGVRLTIAIKPKKVRTKNDRRKVDPKSVPKKLGYTMLAKIYIPEV